MSKTHVVTGIVLDPRTISLDEALPTDGVRVRVWVELLSTGPKPTMTEAVAELRARQQARGHVPMTTAEIDALMADPPTDGNHR